MNTVAVYRSRSDALKLNYFLSKERVACTTISTPASLKLGCGLSVVFNENYTDIVNKINKTNNLNSFLGFYPKK